MAKLKGYGIVFNDTMRNKNISVKAKAVYAYLSSCAGAKNFCFPSRDLICNHLGICQSTLTPLIRELENEGVLRCEKKRTRKGKFKKTLYILNTPSADNGSVQYGSADSGNSDYGNSITNNIK